MTPTTTCISIDRQTESPGEVTTPILLARVAYFSAVTFTTLGYGDYHPVGWVKLIAAAEAFMGAATIALVTVIFARRFIR